MDSAKISEILDKYGIRSEKELEEQLKTYQELANRDYVTMEKSTYEAFMHDEKAFNIVKRSPLCVIKEIDTYDTWKEYCEDYNAKERKNGFIKTKAEFELLKDYFGEF